VPRSLGCRLGTNRATAASKRLGVVLRIHVLLFAVYRYGIRHVITLSLLAVFIPCEARTLVDNPLFRAILFPAKALFEPPYSFTATEKHARRLNRGEDCSSPHANSSAASRRPCCFTAPMLLHGAHAASRRPYLVHGADTWFTAPILGSRRRYCFTAPILLHGSHTAPQPPCRRVDIYACSAHNPQES
jgi:hypothetical protein